MEAHRQGIDDLDLAHVRLDLLGSRSPIALVAELDVLARDGIAVVEFEIAPQLELIHEPVGALRPRLGEARRHLALARQRPDERVVKGEENPERRDLSRRGRRIEPGRRDRDVPGDDDLAGGARLTGGFMDRSEGEDDGREQQGDAAM